MMVPELPEGMTYWMILMSGIALFPLVIRYYIYTGAPERTTVVDTLREEVIRSLRKAAAQDKVNLREKDLAIQFQREAIERLEHRVAADTKSLSSYRATVQTVQCQREDIERLEHCVAGKERLLNWQTKQLKIMDEAILAKDRMTQQLKKGLAESNTHIRDLQWDIESFEAQVKDKDNLLWTVTGRGTTAIQAICHLQDRLQKSTEALQSTVQDDIHAIDCLEAKYVKAIVQLSDKLAVSDKRLSEQTADAKALQAHISERVPHLMACIKSRDFALKEIEDIVKTTEIDRDILIAEYKSKVYTDLEAEKMDRRVLADKLANVGNELNVANFRLADSYAASDELVERYESEMESAASQRRDLQIEIDTLTAELSECKRRLSTVNSLVLSHKTHLASVREAKATLESKLTSANQLAEDNGNQMGFAKLALENALNELKTLNDEKTKLKLVNNSYRSGSISAESSLAEARDSLHIQREKAERSAMQLIKTEGRYKQSKSVAEELYKAARDLKDELEISSQRLAQSESARHEFKSTYINLAAKLATAEDTIMTASTALAESQREEREQHSHRVKLAEQLVVSKSHIGRLEAQASESNDRHHDVVRNLRLALQLVHRLKEQNLFLKRDLKEESKAREHAEGYVNVEEGDSEGGDGSGYDASEEDEVEDEDDEEEFEALEFADLISS